MINIMADKIRFVREEHKSVIKVAKDFVVNDQTIRNWLYAIQKKHKLYAKRKRKYKATTNSNHEFPVAKNILN